MALKLSLRSNVPLLEAVDIKKTYEVGSEIIHAVDGISLTVNAGDYISIVGKSGSGKSTLMHILGLLDTPTSGILKLHGEEVGTLEEVELAKIRNREIGFVFQSFNLLARTTALDNVILPLRYSNVPKSEWEQKAKETLELVGLGDRLNNKSNELSGGQKQRVAIARALVTKPSIVFADEPTGNLDTKTGDEIVDLFENLNEEGRTIVIVTHDEDLANVTRTKLVIKDGKLI